MNTATGTEKFQLSVIQITLIAAIGGFHSVMMPVYWPQLSHILLSFLI